jgi:hypothetical protein
MADALRKKLAIDALVEQEVTELRKRHPELDLGDAYGRVFAENPLLYRAYTETTAITASTSDD